MATVSKGFNAIIAIYRSTRAHLFPISPSHKNEVMNLLLFLIQDSHIQVFFNSCRFVRWPNKRYPGRCDTYNVLSMDWFPR
jgi:hypothetical protein